MSDSKRLQTDLVKVVDDGRLPDKRLGPRADAAGIPITAGSARPRKPTGASSGTAGIASPLTEPDYEDRTYHSVQSYTSVDGIWVIELYPVHEIIMQDDNGAEAKFIYDAPP